MSKNNLSQSLIVLSGIFLSYAIGNAIAYISFISWNIWYVAIIFYLLIVNVLLYIYLNITSPIKFKINPLEVILLPAIPALFFAKHLFGHRKDVCYRPAIDFFFFLSFLYFPIAANLELEELKQNITSNFIPYVQVTIVGMSIFLLYIFLEEWEKIKQNRNLKKSLAGLIGVNALFGLKPTFFWSWTVKLLFISYAILVVVWLYKTRLLPIKIRKN
jgi:hypothetical protein